MSHSTEMDWKSSTEFFEGDGAVSVRLGRAKNSKVLQICIVIGQKWKPKLEQIDRFLRRIGIDSAKIYLQKYGYTLRIFRISAVRTILANILACSFLKREQIQAALDYLNGEITGDDVIAIFNREYELGKRRTRPPAISAPLTKQQLKVPGLSPLKLEPVADSLARFTRRGRTRFRVPSSSS